MTFRQKLAVGTVIAAVLTISIWALAQELTYRVDLGRRHHQIGQLWTFCTLYYCPTHGNRFPHDLDELRRMPEYADASAYWDRALSEIELIASGADSAATGGAGVVVFREKKPDRRGIRAFHEVGGAYGFTEESGDASPRSSHPAYIGG